MKSEIICSRTCCLLFFLLPPALLSEPERTIFFLHTKSPPDSSEVTTNMVFGIETQVPLGQPLRKNSSSALSHGSSSNLELHSHGDENTTEYRIKAAEKSGSKTISLWHDVTLVHVDPATDRPTPYLNFVCEIPKFSR